VLDVGLCVGGGGAEVKTVAFGDEAFEHGGDDVGPTVAAFDLFVLGA